MQCGLEIPGLARPIRLKVHSGPDRVSEYILHHHIWEPYETTLVMERLRAGAVFLDIGANIGYYSVLAGTVVGEHGLVIAYEPDAENFRLLEHNIALNHLTNVRPFQAALGDHTGKGYMYLSQDNRGDHQLFDVGEGRRKAAVEIVPGDQHVAGLSSHVDFIKIDTQGSEVHVLKGLRNMILANRAYLSMIIEFWPFGLRQAGASGTELLELIAEYDIPVSIIDHVNRQLTPAPIDFLQLWVDETDADPTNQGFINLLLSRTS